MGHAGTLHFGSALRLHELNGETEESACLAANHLEVFLLGGASERVAPEEVEALAAVEVQELFRVNLEAFRVVEFVELFEGLEVDIVGGIDGLSYTEDTVRNGYPAAQA